jgi:LemA protein
MSITLIIFGAISVIIYALYASLIHKKNKVKEASSGIDVQLKKRCDSIPNLLQIAAKFMKHEKELMNDITRLRIESMKQSFKDNPEQVIQVENELSDKLHSFNLSVGNYPDLKSNQTMLQAMTSLAEAEESIAAARRFYNAAVNDLNNAVEIFPSSFIAKCLHIKSAVFFEANSQERAAINVKDYLS